MRDLGVRDLILGTMKSAKSAQLIMKGFILDSQSKNVLTLKPEKDNRDGEFVVSRALPIQRPAIIIPTDNNGSMISMLVFQQMPDVILLDELQFFTVEQIEKLALISVTYDVDIYAYGLMMSYNGKMFDSVKRAIECGFRTTTLDMSCDECNNDATHHLLYVDGELAIDGESIVVEDDEFKKKNQDYKSVCYSCYRKAVERRNMNKNKK